MWPAMPALRLENTGHAVSPSEEGSKNTLEGSKNTSTSTIETSVNVTRLLTVFRILIGVNLHYKSLVEGKWRPGIEITLRENDREDVRLCM